MTKTSRNLFLSAFGAFIGLAILLNAPPIFGPIYDYFHDYYYERSSLEQCLASCPSDEMRFKYYYEKNGSAGAALNFKTKTLEGGDSNPSVKWSWSGRMVSFFQNMELGGGAPFTDEQIGKIRSLLAALPPSNATGPTNLESYRDRFHLAFYQGEQLCVYHYSKGEADPQLEELCRTLGVGGEFFP